jgi:DNA-directed RNA polymerase specialized sigma24 family protein
VSSDAQVGQAEGIEQARHSFVFRVSKRFAMHPDPLSPSAHPEAPAASSFPATLWTVVLDAGSDDADRALHALHDLCIRYQRAIHAWFQRSRPHWIPPARAEEWAQDFLLFMGTRNPFRRLERRENRFRSFLVSCLKNFLKDKLAAERAAKRGGNTEHLDIAEIQLAAAASPLDELLDAEFARELHTCALARVERQWMRKGTPERYAALKGQILGHNESSYEELAKGLGVTANHVKKIVFDLREAYYNAFRDEVGQIVPDQQTQDEEMRYLIGLLVRPNAAPP